MKKIKNTKKKKELKVILTPSFVDSFEKLFSNNIRFLVPRKINDWKFEIKWAWQRVFRGYDDRLTWDLHSYISDYLPKLIREMKKMAHGYPSSHTGKSEIKNIKQWKEILEKIAKGFDAAKKIENTDYMKKIKLKKPKKDIFGKDSYVDYKFDKKCYNKLNKEFEEGVELFKKWYFNLWD